MVRFRPWPPFEMKRPLSRGLFHVKRGQDGARTISWFAHFETLLSLSFTLLACRFGKRIGVRAVRRHVTKRQDRRFAQTLGCPKGEVHGCTECNCLRKGIRANPSLATNRRRRRRRVSDRGDGALEPLPGSIARSWFRELTGGTCRLRDSSVCVPERRVREP